MRKHGVCRRESGQLFSQQRSTEIALQFQLVGFLRVGPQRFYLGPAQSLCVQFRCETAQSGNELCSVQRLQQVIADPKTESLHSVFKLVIPAQHQQLCLRQKIRQAFQKLQSVHVGHRDIRQHRIGQNLPRQRQRLASVPRQCCNIPFRAVLPHKIRHALADALLIVRYQ